MNYISEFLPLATDWLLLHGTKIIIILLGTIVVNYTSRIFIERIIRKFVKENDVQSKEAEKRREDTLIRIVNGTLRTGVMVIAGLMILSEIGINIGPLLAAAGVAGLAIGFGGQYLIRDVVAGFFIIIENQFRVGDVVCLDGTCGLVEDLSIRMTTLRDLDGTVHHVPHGVVQKVSNLTKVFARVNLNIGVSYNADLEEVIRVINAVGEEMTQDAEWKDRIISTIHFERVDDFADSAIMVKILGDTQPLHQWAVAGEFRKRLKIAFDKAGIEIPFPQRVVHTTNNS